jgi:hypothetical protein
VPHLRDGLIVAKVGNFRGSENPDTLNSPMPLGLKRYHHEGDDHPKKFGTANSPCASAISPQKNTFQTPKNKGKNACQAPKPPNSLKPNHIAVAYKLSPIRYN